MYFEDLTPYSYVENGARAGSLNVGWLDDKHSFPKGTVPEDVLDALFRICADKKANQTRGFHSCLLCRTRPRLLGVRVERGGREIRLGSAEVHLTASDGTSLVAPDMIYHYVVDHGYLPPTVFLEALRKHLAR